MRRMVMTSGLRTIHEEGPDCSSVGCVSAEWRVTLRPGHSTPLPTVSPDGWVVVGAADYDSAVEMVRRVLGSPDCFAVWGQDDEPHHPEGPSGWEETYPLGETMRIWPDRDGVIRAEVRFTGVNR